MELRHLRYFAALAEQLNFTNAAEKVHITQSTLSHQIKQLEEEVGAKLFDRTGKRVKITEVGESFLVRVLGALREVDEGLLALKHSSDDLDGEIRIGATHTFNLRIIPRCVSIFIAQHPSVKVSVIELSGDAIAQGLSAEELDIGVAYKPQDLDALRFEPLYNEEMVLVVATDHHFAKRKWLRMVDLHLQRLVLLPKSFATRQLLDDCFRMANAEPIVAAEMNTIAPMLEFVSITDIAGIVSEHAVRRADLCVIPIESPTPVRAPGLLWKRDGVRSAAVRNFAAIIRQVTEEANPRKAARKAPMVGARANRSVG
jgi:LysR family cyn operon transcriptional activator